LGNAFKIIGIIVVVAIVLMVGVPIIDLRTDDPVVTFVKFEQIRNGMTYEKIVDIVEERRLVRNENFT
jgi:hypothetical protein